MSAKLGVEAGNHINPVTIEVAYTGPILVTRLDELMTVEELEKYRLYLPEDQEEMLAEIGGIIVIPAESQRLDEGLIAIVESETRSGVVHQIRQNKAGDIYCTCESYTFSYNPCKHMKDWARNHSPVEINSPLANQLLHILGAE